MKKKAVKIIMIMAILALAGCGLLLGINFHVKNSTKDSIITPEQAAALEEVDCIIVLGCKVRAPGVPSNMLADRLDRGIELYELKASPKILMSGDHGQNEYDEVNTMKAYAVDAGIPSEDVFMDHAGFSTYESIFRLKAIFGVKKAIVVTQGYHLHRALFIAEKLGVEAYGVASDYHIYSGQTLRELREIIARNKDAVKVLFKPDPKYLGESISIDGDGNVTNDK